MRSGVAVVLRDVGSEEPHNYLGRDAHAGEIFYVYQGHDYGCINYRGGIALSEGGPFETPFFEFPSDAVEIRTVHDPEGEVRAGVHESVLPREGEPQ